jgi:hypothetical protein
VYRTLCQRAQSRVNFPPEGEKTEVFFREIKKSQTSPLRVKRHDSTLCQRALCDLSKASLNLKRSENCPNFSFFCLGTCDKPLTGFKRGTTRLWVILIMGRKKLKFFSPSGGKVTRLWVILIMGRKNFPREKFPLPFGTECGSFPGRRPCGSFFREVESVESVMSMVTT